MELTEVHASEFAANRSGNMALDLIDTGDILELANGTWVLLVSEEGCQSWKAQELAIKPNAIDY